MGVSNIEKTMTIEWEMKLSKTVDEHMRQYGNSRVVRQLRRNYILIASIVTGLMLAIILYIVFEYIGQWPGTDWRLIAFPSILTSLIAVPVFYWYYQDILRHRTKRLILEQCGKGPFHVRLVLSSDGMQWSSEGVHTLMEWNQVKAVTENDDGIEVITHQGASNRIPRSAFSAPHDVELFVKDANARIEQPVS
jgi:hypothetical protein